MREPEKDYVEIENNITENNIIVGDFHAHLGNDPEGITGNNEKIGTNR